MRALLLAGLPWRMKILSSHDDSLLHSRIVYNEAEVLEERRINTS
jgi:hypothetical protein